MQVIEAIDFKMGWTILVHGGAGLVLRESLRHPEPAYRAALRAALHAGAPLHGGDEKIAINLWVTRLY